MTEFDDRDRWPDDVSRAWARGERGLSVHPETDLGEGNSSPHVSEDYRRTIDGDETRLFTDPVTGEAQVLP